MSSESSSGGNSSSGSSSDGSSSRSRTESRSVSEQAMAQSLKAHDNNLAPERPAGGGLGPSHDDAGGETDTNVEIVEEGEEGETTGPVSAAVRGQLDLTLITYWIGHSRITEADLDKYVEQGLLKASLRGLCRAPGQEEVPRPEPYEAVVFYEFLNLDCDFPVRTWLAKFCSASIYRSIT